MDCWENVCISLTSVLLHLTAMTVIKLFQIFSIIIIIIIISKKSSCNLEVFFTLMSILTDESKHPGATECAYLQESSIFMRGLVRMGVLGSDGTV